MSFVNHFYNSLTRKYVSLFGTLFNKISITRNTTTGTEVQRMVVPISYGPYQKFLARIIQDPDLNKKSAITLPRMSFEITSMSYDGSRKIGSTQKIHKTRTGADKTFQWSAAPYNVEFSLYIMTKYSEDATKIVEQILPFFMPEWTTTVKLIEDIEPLDIPLILNSVSNEELYEGAFDERRAVLWTLNFSMKCWYFGPERTSKVIKFIDVDLHDNIETNSTASEKITIQPGLTANGHPTTDINETIPYQDIDFDDDWDIIRVIEEVNSNE